jgi:hypothetical protein
MSINKFIKRAEPVDTIDRSGILKGFDDYNVDLNNFQQNIDNARGLRSLFSNISFPDSIFTPLNAYEFDVNNVQSRIDAAKNREILNRQGLLSLDDAGIDMAPTIDEFSNKAKPGLNINFAKQLGSTALGLLTGNPLVGLLARGIGALGDRFKLPGRVGGVDLRGDTGFDTFRRSTSLADFLQRRRDKKAREEARRIGADKQRMNAFRAFRDSQPSGGDGGGGNIQGSISRGGTDDTPGTPF